MFATIYFGVRISCIHICNGVRGVCVVTAVKTLKKEKQSAMRKRMRCEMGKRQLKEMQNDVDNNRYKLLFSLSFVPFFFCCILLQLHFYCCLRQHVLTIKKGIVHLGRSHSRRNTRFGASLRTIRSRIQINEKFGSVDRQIAADVSWAGKWKEENRSVSCSWSRLLIDLWWR